MKKIGYHDICGLNCVLDDIIAYNNVFTDNDVFNYEQTGRSKNLLYYQLDGTRIFSFQGEKECTVGDRDIIFIPDGTRYVSRTISPISEGIGISFNFLDELGEKVRVDEPSIFRTHEETGELFSHFRQIYYSALRLPGARLRLQGELLTLLDKLFSVMGSVTEFEARHKDIAPALKVMERHPEKNFTNAELARMCHVSESSFLRKFKVYSGGITPARYRNNIRVMKAEEYVNSDNTLEQIAQMLGFYDAAHLCKAYKKHTGHSPKKYL